MADRKSEDLFETSRMSFGSHIEELRVVLLRSLLGIGIGFAIGLWVGPKVVVFLQEPMAEAIEDFQRKQAVEKIRKELGYVPPAVAETIKTEKMIPRRYKIAKMELINAISGLSDEAIIPEADRLVRFNKEHVPLENSSQLAQQFVEHKTAEQKVLWSKLSQVQQQAIESIASADQPDQEQHEKLLGVLNSLVSDQSVYEDDAFNAMIANNSDFDEQEKTIADGDEGEHAQNEIRSLNMHLITDTFSDAINTQKMSLITVVLWESIASESQALGIQEAFMIWLKAGFFVGLAIASPWVFVQIWSFVATGLYPHEKNYVYLYMPFSLLLFVAGAAFAFYVVFGFVLEFLFKFNADMNIAPVPRIGEYLGFVMMLPVGFGFAFQLPLVMLFLCRIGLISIETYLSKWRIAILVVCIISMVCTPSDPISMILMALPLIGLYFLGIGLCKWLPKGKKQFRKGYDPV